MQDKPAYTLTELAELFARPRRYLARLVATGRLPVKTANGQRVVTAATLRATWPELWESVLLREQMTDGARGLRE